jgi:anti-sigma factor RsiW
MDCNQAQPLLNAYADGELDLMRHLEVEAHLQTCPACARVVGNVVAGRDALREALPRYPAPISLTQRIQASLPKPTAIPLIPAPRSTIAYFGKYLGMAASLLVALSIGIIAGMNYAKTTNLTDEAVAAHVRSLMAEHLTDVASTDQHTVKPWFAGKIDFSPPVVDLATDGFPLIGGRLERLDHRPVAALVFRRREHAINLFIWPADATALAERSTHSDGYQTMAWSEGGMNYVVVSEISATELADFVKTFRAHIMP